MPLRLDTTRLAKTERTPQGFLRVEGRIARTGILSYRMADGTTVRELRLPQEVFAPRSLQSARAGVPITVGHPAHITAANARQHKIGQTVTDAQPDDGRFVTAKLQIEDPDAIQKIDRGELVELSAGYQVDLDPTPGVWEGHHYDAIQRNIIFNHAALIGPGQGRSGHEVALRLDSLDAVSIDTPEIVMNEDSIKLKIGDREHEMTRALADAFSEMQTMLDAANKNLASRDQKLAEQAALLAQPTSQAPTSQANQDAKLGHETARADQAEKKLQALEGQIRLDQLQQAKDLDARVAQRVALVEQAHRILGSELKADGATDRAIREQVLTKAGTKHDASLSDDYIRGAFEQVTLNAKGSPNQLTSVVVPPVPGEKQDQQDPHEGLAERARQEAIKQRAQQYKLKSVRN